jgi:hypothetical protein
MLASDVTRLAEPDASVRDRLAERQTALAQIGDERAHVVLDLVEIGAGELGFGRDLLAVAFDRSVDVVDHAVLHAFASAALTMSHCRRSSASTRRPSARSR